VRSTGDQLTKGLSDEDLALFSIFRDFGRSLPDTEERVHTTEVQFARKRIFTSGFMRRYRGSRPSDAFGAVGHSPG
jgi:hypothetical protein